MTTKRPRSYKPNADFDKRGTPDAPAGPEEIDWKASYVAAVKKIAELEASLSAQADVRAATIEECAKIAAKYGDVPCSSPHNNTLEAFNRGMNHRTGCVDSACCIEEAIRALSDAKQPEGK